MAAAESPGSSRKRRTGGHQPVAVRAMMVLFAPLIWLLSLSRTAVCNCLRKMAVTAVATALALAPLPLASAHDPLALATAESAQHADLAAQEAAEHGHSHDDDAAHEQSEGHLHGHDPADHSHQFAFFAGSASQWGLPSPQRWPSSRSGPPDPATAIGIDRPPKQAMSF